MAFTTTSPTGPGTLVVRARWLRGFIADTFAVRDLILPERIESFQEAIAVRSHEMSPATQTVPGLSDNPVSTDPSENPSSVGMATIPLRSADVNKGTVTPERTSTQLVTEFNDRTPGKIYCNPIGPARPTVESVPSPAESSRTPSAPPAAPAVSAARYLEEFCDRDYHVSTPERAVTPGLSKAELLEYDQDAQPLFDPTEVALMGNEHLFTEFPSFNVLCDLAVVSTGFALQHEYYSPKDKNNRLLRCSYAVVDEYSRKFMSVGLNPLKMFKPTATVVANRRVRISVNRINVKSLKSHEFVILSEDEIDRVLESEAFLTSKIKNLQVNAEDLQKKYLQLLQGLAVRMIKKG
ncbi:hypothetical protein CBL_20105 [Carabus blaptoides fortunei]